MEEYSEQENPKKIVASLSMEEILAKQMEVSSHQRNFNLILAVATTFLVLIYALNGFLSFSGYPRIIFGFIVGIMIMFLIGLFLFMKKQGYFKIEKLSRLF